jgi:hypothetical protein
MPLTLAIKASLSTDYPLNVLQQNTYWTLFFIFMPVSKVFYAKKYINPNI